MKTQYQYKGLEPSLSAQFLTTTKHFSTNTFSSTLKHKDIAKLSTGFTSSNPLQLSNSPTAQNDNTFYPRGLQQALSSQSCNIAKFKKRIQKQKNSLSEFINSLCQQINHIIQDFKLSLFAKLDIQYQEYLVQYAVIKNQVEALQMERKMVRMESMPSLITTPIADNKELIVQMKRVEEEYKNRHVRSRLLEVGFQSDVDLQRLVSHVLKVSQCNDSFINQVILRQKSDKLLNIINRYVQPLYGDLDGFIMKSNSILSQEPKFNTNSTNYQQIKYHQNITYEPKFLLNQLVTKVKATIQQQSHSSTNLMSKPIKYKQSQNFMVVSPQNLVVQQGNNISISDNFCVRSLHTDKTLCCVGFKNQIITGGKDAIITVNSLDGQKVITLRGHKSSICCLNIIKSGNKTLIASGGDLGCGNLILWDTDKWSMFYQIQAHTAAISSIVDGGDGQTVITSSYDKSIKLINYLKNEVIQTQICQKPVISLAINSNKSRLISVHLSETINVWEIKHSNKQIFKIDLKNQIQNDSVNTIVLFSMTDREIIISGDQNGFVKLWNTESGNCVNSYKCHEFLIIDMIVVDRLSKKNFPFIISIGKRDKQLTLTDTQTNRIKTISLQNQINIELGCGIGPKMFMLQNTPNLQLGLVSQSQNRKQVQICDFKIQ